MGSTDSMTPQGNCLVPQVFHTATKKNLYRAPQPQCRDPGRGKIFRAWYQVCQKEQKSLGHLCIRILHLSGGNLRNIKRTPLKRIQSHFRCSRTPTLPEQRKFPSLAGSFLWLDRPWKAPVWLRDYLFSGSLTEELAVAPVQRWYPNLQWGEEGLKWGTGNQCDCV